MQGIPVEWVEQQRQSWKTEPLKSDDIATYRINYDIPSWSACVNQFVGLPIGAALVIERLCCEVERLTAELVNERERCARITEGVERPGERHWIPGSLYDTLRRETAAEIRRA